MRLINTVFFVYCCIALISCKGKNDYCCGDVDIIEIENNSFELNRGLESKVISDSISIAYICKSLQNIPENNIDVPVNYNEGVIRININRRSYDLVITINNGNLYRSADGTFAKNDSLTSYIVKLLEIEKLHWFKSR